MNVFQPQRLRNAGVVQMGNIFHWSKFHCEIDLHDVKN